MSLYKKDGRQILFIHIPKTGGTSISQMLEINGWSKIESKIEKTHRGEILCKDNYSHHPHHAIWSKWEKTWDFEFTLVRNPYERFLSQARLVARESLSHDKEISPEGVIEWAKTIFFNLIPRHGKGMDDNHFRSQSEFTGNNTRIYRLEDQKNELISELISQNIISDDTVLPHLNKTQDNDTQMIIAWPLYPKIHNEFLNFYKDDFNNFDYSVSVPTYSLNINWDKNKRN